MDWQSWAMLVFFVVYGLLVVGGSIYLVAAIIQAAYDRRVRRSLVRALLSVLQSTSDPEAQLKQVTRHYRSGPKPTGTPDLPVLLEKLVFERDSLGVARFQSRYGVEVSNELRNTLHALAEISDEQKPQEPTRKIPEPDPVRPRASPKQRTSLNPSSNNTLRGKAMESLDEDRRRHRQNVLMWAIGLIVSIAVGVAGIIVAL
jgi:hypothetical protein